MAPQAQANVRVLVRVRPLNKKELTERGSIGRANALTLDSSSNGNIDFNGEIKENGATISVNNVGDSNRRMTATDFRAGYTSDGDMNNSNGGPSKQYMFDAVHGERSTQNEVYDSVKGIVDAVVGGYNGTIVAYGQTGSGKTHTVFGNGESGNEEEAGLIHRSLRDIFHKISIAQGDEAPDEFDDNYNENVQRDNSKTTFRGSFFEIFNERVFDLLSSDSLEKTLAVREDSNGVYVEGLKEIEVGNTSDAQALLTRGLANRHVASTNMNRASSRSHAVFVLSLKTKHTTPEGLRKVRNSRFTLVDLAGSERQKSTDAIGNRLKEASMINKSLLCLGHVINALVDKEHGRTRHVPFRNSKLTFLLKDTWGGNSKTCLVATVSPSGSSLSETVSTLTFAQRAKLIKNNAILNEDTCGTVAALQAEVAKLRSKLQESSSTVVERIVDTEISSNNDEIVRSMKRRNERAEIRIADLEKQISDEAEIVNTLKRKVQEETMVRKFKERRLEYFHRKARAVSENDEQVELLQAEIRSLQNRLDTPSEDAIVWRVAYEETREALDKKLDEGDSDYANLVEKKSDLEDTVDRLCAEKFELKTKITDLTKSSNETRQEIESIINEVDILEKEMVSCQEQLTKRDDQCKEYEKRAKDAETQLEQAIRTRDLATTENEQLAEQIAGLQASANDYSQRVFQLTEILRKKNEDLYNVESLVDEKEKELQYVIDELREELAGTTADLSARNDFIKDIEKRLSSAFEENQNLSAQIKAAISEVNSQKAKVIEMDEKIQLLTQEKESSVVLAEKDSHRMEEDCAKRLATFSGQIAQLSEEKYDLESKLSTAMKNANSSREELEEKQVNIRHLENKILRMSEVHAAASTSLESKLSEVNGKFWIAKDRLQVLNEKIADVEVQRKVAIKNIEDETNLMAENLGNEINGLKRRLDHSYQENKELQKTVDKFDAKEKELKLCIESLMDAIRTVDDNVKSVQEANKLSMEKVSEKNHHLSTQVEDAELKVNKLKAKVASMEEDKTREVDLAKRDSTLIEAEYSDRLASVKDKLAQSLKEKNDLKWKLLHAMEKSGSSRHLQEQVSNLETERDELLEEMYQINEELTNIVEENITLQTQIQHNESQIEVLEVEVARTGQCYQKSLSVHQDSIDELSDRCTRLTNLKNQFEEELIEKENEVSKISAEFEQQQSALDKACLKIQESLKSQEALKTSFEEAALTQKSEMSSLSKAKEELEIEISLCRTEMEKLINTDESRKKEILLLQTQSKTLEADATDAISKLNESEVRLESLLNQQKANEVDELEAMELKFLSLQRDHSGLTKTIEAMASSADGMEMKFNSLQDRFTLLKREKGNIEYELETIQQGHNALNDQVCTLSSDNNELRSENDRLQRFIKQMQIEGNQSYISDTISSSGSTWNSDPRLSYETLTSNMNSMLEKITEKCTAGSPEKTNDAQDEEIDGANLDDSFDESMFLPNIEHPDNNAEEESTRKSVGNEDEKSSDNIQILDEIQEESFVTKPSVSFCSTPSRCKDYGKRRIPLSDRKNRTPLSTQSKRLRSSSKKAMSSSSKKSRTNYMLINNEQLFG